MWTARRQAPDEWGAGNRVYGGETGWPGPRNPRITPYAIPFGRAFEDPRHRRVVLVTAAQSGKTETFLDVIGERLDNRPAPILYVGPSRDFLTDQFEPRLVGMFGQSASLARKVVGGIEGSRQKKTMKRVAGVRIRLAHAGSSTALKSDPAAFVLVDEMDEMMANVRGQGDPLGLVEARGDTYADFVVGVTSTPSLGRVEPELDAASGLEFWGVADEEDIKSPIWRLWQAGTRHHWCWPCPSCDEFFVPRFRLLQWPDGASPAVARRSAFLSCPRCGGVIEESQKAAMNARGVYVAPGQVVDVDGTVTGEPTDSSTLSFWVSGLASPFVSFGERAERYLTALATGETAKIQAAVNAGAGEVFAPDLGDVPEWQEVAGLAMPYAAMTVPDQVILLTAGVDVQGNRLVYVIRGWGARATSWLITHGELWGRTAEPAVWLELSELLRRTFDGLPVKYAFVDSGFRPGKKVALPVNQVYEFCRRHRTFVFPSKGASAAMVKPLIVSDIDVEPDGRADTYGLDLVRLDAGYWKGFVQERLRWPSDQPGAFHIHESVDPDYCRQLVSEAPVRKDGGGWIWVQRSRDNHFLDAEALAAAAGFLAGAQNITVERRNLGSREPLVSPNVTAAIHEAQARPSAPTLQPSRLGALAARLNRR